MLRYWSTGHKELVLERQPALNYTAYEQLHVRDVPELSAVGDRLEGNVLSEYDGVAALAHEHQWAVVAAFLNPFAQLANFRLLNDELTFIDHRRSALVFGREYVLAGDAVQLQSHKPRLRATWTISATVLTPNFNRRCVR